MDKQIAMCEGGKKLKQVLIDLVPQIATGTKLIDIDSLATKLIYKVGATPSFSTVSGYRWSTCLSVNEVIVHGVPNEYKLKSGDVLKLDIGLVFGGYHIDYGDTLVIGEAESKVLRFLDVGRLALKKALTLVKSGVHIGIVSNHIQRSIEGAGYKVVHELTGHAVGRELHMEPYIPGILEKPIKNTPRFVQGIAYAIEVIYSFADEHITYANNDGWSLRTKSFSQSACFENSVYVDSTKSIILV